MTGVKIVTVDVDSELGPIDVLNFDDTSAAIEQDCMAVSAGKAPGRRKLARALSPVYVVKAQTGNYAGYSAKYNDETGEERPEGRDFDWTKQTKAVRFTSKKAASVVAKAFPHAGARVVRLK